MRSLFLNYQFRFLYLIHKNLYFITLYDEQFHKSIRVIEECEIVILINEINTIDGFCEIQRIEMRKSFGVGCEVKFFIAQNYYFDRAKIPRGRAFFLGEERGVLEI